MVWSNSSLQTKITVWKQLKGIYRYRFAECFKTFSVTIVVSLCPIVAHRFENELYIYQKLLKTQENIAPTFYGANKNRHTIFVKYGGERIESNVSVKFTRTHTQSTQMEHTRKHTIKSHAQSTHQPHTNHTPNNMRTYSDMFNQDCTAEMKERIVKLAQDFLKSTGRHHGSIRLKNVLLCSGSILLIDFEQTVNKTVQPSVCEPGVFCISHNPEKQFVGPSLLTLPETTT